MSDVDEVVQANKDGKDAAKSDADQAQANDDGKEFAKKDSGKVKPHHTSSEKDITKNPEGQVRAQANSGQDEVKGHTGQDQARANSSRQCESDTDEVQHEGNNAEKVIAKVAVDQVHIQENSGVQDTAGNNIGEIQPQINSGEKDEAMSEKGQVQINTNDGGQDESQSESGQVQNQANIGGQDEAQSESGRGQNEAQSESGLGQDGTPSESGQVQDQPTSGGQDEAQSEIGPDQDQPTSGGQDKAQSEIGLDHDQPTSGGQDEAQREIGLDQDQPTSGGQDEAQSEIGQDQDQPTSGGQDEAQSEIEPDQDQPTSGGQDAAQNESGQDQANSDEKYEAKSGTSQVQPQANGGRKVVAKSDVGKVKPQITGGRAGVLTGKTVVLTGKRFPTYIGKKSKFAVKRYSRKTGKASSDLWQAKSAPGQAQAKTVLAKPKPQVKSGEKGKLNVLVADKVQPQPTGEKKLPLSAGKINNASDTKKTVNVMTSVTNKDLFQANRDVTGPPASGGPLASKDGKSMTMFWCDICKVVCTSALNLQMHFLGFKHKKIEAALKWNVHNAEGITKDEFLAPMETRTVEDHLSKMKLNKAVLGLDYVVEYRYDQKTNPQFVCKLCHCKSELTWFLPHLLGTKHMANYLEKHYPDILNYEGEKLKPSEWKEFVIKKALEIEKKDGRGKVTVVLEKIGTKTNEKTAVKRVAEQSAVEPERKLQKSEATPSTVIDPIKATEKAKPKDQSMPAPAQDIQEDETWTGMYLYPDGLPITVPVDPKPQPRPVLARQGVTATRGAVAVNDLLSSIGSKVLEDHIKKSDFEETIIGLDFVTEYHYKGKTEPLYYCELCNCELPLQCILAHIFGLKHKMSYVKRRHPELLKLNAGKYKLIVRKKATEIEKLDGRGTVRVVRDFDGPALSERIAATRKSEDGSQLPDMEYSSVDQDQSTNMETSCSPDTRTKRTCASTSSKPSSRASGTRAGSRSDPKYPRHESSKSKRDQTRKRESSKDIRHSGEDWRDEWERSIKRAKSIKQDKREKERDKERSKHSDRDKDRRRESKRDSKDDYKKRDKSRSCRDDDRRGSDDSYQAPERYGHSEPEDITKKEILGYLTNFKVINDTDAGYVKGIMYKLSNRLLQFGQKAMKMTGSAAKLIEETKKSSIPDEHPRYESRKAAVLGSYSGYSDRDQSMRQSVEYSSYPSSGTLTRSSSHYPTAQPVAQNIGASLSSIHSNLLTPALLNSIRGMDVNTITSTLTRLAANNPAFEGIRISTLVTVLMEAGVLSKRPN